MRSSDLARLAGVSVRTLRHYHQIGLLPEPDRSANGYRVYTAADLVRVLRVRRLADLGMPLSRIDPAVDTEEELALLDREYVRQIEELQQRRAAIGALRQSTVRVDTPAFAQKYITALDQRDGVASQPVEAERDAAVLLELLLDSGSAARLTVLNEGEIAELADVSAALLALPDDAPDAGIDAVADALASALRRLQPVFSPLPLTREAAQSLEDHVDDQLSSAQRDTIRRALHRLLR
ncbi:MerR family transcriptional regulator [Glaciihabitans sp. dw_435]|uniref:MerR family transcriptional regulator n=1 Tax=Glaciihabitans sp. dw_435 TaxID=2720081 RepID=UPI001BD1C8E8|nr:MerR family transcriptional regulator [Glaciihabitans sp. dw_435]